MRIVDGRPLQAAYACEETPAGALVVAVYRCAMAGFSVGQIECWNVDWQALRSAVSSDERSPAASILARAAD